MDMSDPVNAAALRMYNETYAYIVAHQAGEEPDPTAMTAATQAYAAAVDASLTPVTTNPENAVEEVQLNKDVHQCMICHTTVTSVAADGSNSPCGHRVPTVVTKKR